MVITPLVYTHNITERYITSHTFIFGDLAWRTLQWQILTLYNVRIRLYACMSYIKSQKPIKTTHKFEVYVYAVVSDFLSTLWADEFFRLNFVESAEEGEK